MSKKLLTEINKIKKIMFVNEDYEQGNFTPTLSDADKINTVKYVGINVTWFGEPGRSGIIPINRIDGMWGNIYYPKKLENLKTLITSMDENIELLTSYCHPYVITLSTIKEEQESVKDGSFETDNDGRYNGPASTGDDEIDNYLASYYDLSEVLEYCDITEDFSRFFKKYHTEIAQGKKSVEEVTQEFNSIVNEYSDYEDEVRETFDEFIRLENRLMEIIEYSEGNLGEMWFQLRDGHHRFKVLQELGERYILCNIDKEFDINEVKKHIKVI